MTTWVKLEKTGVKNTHLGVIGSVEDVIAGRVQPALKKRQLQAKDYYCGFELASPHSLESMGESVLVNGFCYTTSTDKDDHYLKTISGEQFLTSGIFLVPHSAQPSFIILPGEDKAGIGYRDFCDHIHKTTKAPCLVAAIVRFKELEAACIQKAPIHGENIFEHKDKYYDGKKLQFKNRYCFLVAAIANFQTDSTLITERLKVVLYQNPFDVKNELNIHTHGILLSSAINNTDDIFPSAVTETVHLYTENTVVSEVLFGKVFVINQVDAL